MQIPNPTSRLYLFLRNLYHKFYVLVRPLYCFLSPALRSRIRRMAPRPVPPLYHSLPLPVPWTINVDPCNICFERCAYCPTGNPALPRIRNRPLGKMPMELFRKIVDDTEAMVRRHGRKIRILHLYKDGEPLLNDLLASMVRYAKARAVAEYVSTTTNGILLTEDRAKQLIDSGLDHIRISVPSGRAYHVIRRNCGFLYQEKTRRRAHLFVHVKAIASLMSARERQRFRRDFGPVSDYLHLDGLMGWSGSPGKDFLLGIPVTKGMDGQTNLREKRICPEPFCRLAINFNGRVSACCVDWCMDASYGDATRMTMEDIWDGALLGGLRILHAQGNRGRNPACNGCHFVKGIPREADLDCHAAGLLKMYSGPARC